MKLLMDRFHIKLPKHPQYLVPINSKLIKTIVSRNANSSTTFFTETTAQKLPNIYK